jgi:hypothetical protein
MILGYASMKNDNNKSNSTSGNLLLISTIALTLLIPVSLILLSYLELINGTLLGHIVTAVAVITASAFIIVGGIWMYVQDKKDGTIAKQTKKKTKE